MEPHEYDEILRTLVRIVAYQETINVDMRAMLTNHDLLLRQQVEINADVKTTLAHIEVLLSRMLRQGENGQEA